MGCDKLESLLLVKGDCALIFRINKQFQLRDSTFFGLFNDTSHQDFCLVSTLVALSYKERSDVASMLNTRQLLTAVATEANESFTFENTIYASTAQNLTATIRTGGSSFI
tara:strand:- start:199 stop:528 length:330 start_codon:yes stop_codon:yes gene_type:complete